MDLRDQLLIHGHRLPRLRPIRGEVGYGVGFGLAFSSSPFLERKRVPSYLLRFATRSPGERRIESWGEEASLLVTDLWLNL